MLMIVSDPSHFFKTNPNCRKIVLLMFLIENAVDFLVECGFLTNDNKHLQDQFKKS